MNIKLSENTINGLVCPCCHKGELVFQNHFMLCENSECKLEFPIVDGRPILINENNSIFSYVDYLEKKITSMDLRAGSEKRKSFISKVKFLLNKATPEISLSINDFSPEQAIQTILDKVNKSPKILVVGAGDAEIAFSEEVEFVYSDVALGKLTQLVCDAHDIPFCNGYFDAVVAVAVLEHVVDPQRCVAEFHRILKKNGYVYAITPFMQQVHMGKYDFTRYTHLGHRRLFRYFSEEKSGVANGPGMVLAWSFERFLSGFSKTRKGWSLLRTISRFLVFWLVYFDKSLAQLPSSYDSASSYYFFGKRQEEPISDREIVNSYKGMFRND